MATACSVKDYPVDRFRLRIRVTGPDTISFDEKDFNGRNFSISGDYRRCSRVYACEGMRWIK